VHDGLGSEPREHEVAVRGDRIVAVGPDTGPARRVVDVTGLAVAPGFIDPHAHSDVVPLLSEPQPFKLLQGVATEIVGNCGFSPAPLTEESRDEIALVAGDLTGGVDLHAGSFADFVVRLDRAGPTNNLACLVGHNTLRLTANGTGRALRAGSLEEMCRLADEAFAAGAVGVSSGLIYPPGSFSDTDELVALAQVAHRWQRPYTTHMRDEGRFLPRALDETVEIGQRGRVRVQVSHCKSAGRANKGGSIGLLDTLHRSRAAGIDVRGDQYPYRAGATWLSALLPLEALDGGLAALQERLRSPGERERLRGIADDPAHPHAGEWREVTPADILVTSHTRAGVGGRTLDGIAGDRDPWDVLCELIEQDPTAAMVITFLDEEDVRAIMADPLISVGSDNGLPLGLQHPRTWGCFPHFLGRYVRELGVVPWPEAVRKLTSAVAGQFGLAGRGVVAAGAVADLCVFDPATIGHPGTYLAPDATPTGVRYVVLGGRMVVDGGDFTGGRWGRVLRAAPPVT
jgi:N-acyl-D-amino-acid deacylase